MLIKNAGGWFYLEAAALVQVKYVTFHSEAITIDSYQEEDGTSVRMEGEPLMIQSKNIQSKKTRQWAWRPKTGPGDWFFII